MVGPMVWYDEPDRSTPVDAAHLNQYSADLAASAAAADASATAAAASAATASAPANTAIDARMKWSGPGTVYALNQQIISPNGDVVKANVAHTSSAAYATDVANWDLSGTFGTAAAVAAKVTTTDRPVSLRGQPGIDWTGAIDSAAAVQAVITAAGAGAKIDIGIGGKIRCDTGLTLLNFQKLEGPVFQLATAIPAVVEFDFSHLTGSAVGITCAASNLISNVLLRGPGYVATTQIGVNSVSGSPEFDHVQFYSWPTAVNLTNSYYTVFNRCEWRYNAVGVSVTTCTNLNFYAPRFYCSNIGNTAWGTALLLLNVNDAPVNIFGGSLEGYQTGITAGTRSQVNLFGVYFESAYAPSPIGVQASSADGAVLNLQGCSIYMENHASWVSTGGGLLSTLIGSGNTFIATTGSVTTPVAYTVAGTGAGYCNVNLMGDNWARVAKGTYYGGTATLPRDNFTVIPPNGAANAGFHYLGLTGCWTAYTPTWTSTGTAPAVGNGTWPQCAYSQVGKTISFTLKFFTGTTTTYGTGTYIFSLPVGASTSAGDAFAVEALIGGVTYTGTAARAAGTAVGLYVYFGSAVMTPTTPGTLANGDHIYISGTYQAA